VGLLSFGMYIYRACMVMSEVDWVDLSSIF
jgi:hypothetical protein